MSQSYIGRGAEPAEAKYHHGQSPAAWTAVIIAGVAFVLGGIAVIQMDWVMLAVAGGLIVLSLVIGGALRAAGLGNR